MIHITQFIAKILISILFILTMTFVKVSAAPRAVNADYFGTGRTDYLWIGGTMDGHLYWDILQNPIITPPQMRRVFFGQFDPQTGNGDIPLIGDWDGDGKSDIAVWRPGAQSYFYIQLSSNPNPNAFISVPWGIATDFPVTGDFDGDGKDDYCVRRNVNGQKVWYILPSGGGGFRAITFGLEDDIEMSSGDLDGDGRDDLVVIRFDSAGRLSFYGGDAQSGSLLFSQQWGSGGIASVFFPFVGNYLGDNRADVGVLYGACDSSNSNCEVAGTWWIKETGSANYIVTRWGIPFDGSTGTGDFPNFNSDYDGDGKFDISVLRPTDNFTVYSILSSNGQYDAQSLNFLPPPEAAPLENFGEPTERKIPIGTSSGIYVSRNADGTFSAKSGTDYFRIEK